MKIKTIELTPQDKVVLEFHKILGNNFAFDTKRGLAESFECLSNTPEYWTLTESQKESVDPIRNKWALTENRSLKKAAIELANKLISSED